MPTPASTMATITSATGTVTTVVGDTFEVMTSNPLLVFFLAAAVIGVGIVVFKQIRKAAKG